MERSTAARVAPFLHKRQRKRLAPPRDRPWARLWLDDFEKRATLSVNARRAFDALLVHFVRCGQTDEPLKVPHAAFERAGVHTNYVKRALDELCAAGLVQRAGLGLPSNAWMEAPCLYRLATYHHNEGVQQRARRRFAWITIDILESDSWRRLSINARRVVDRLLLENAKSLGAGNGTLRVSFQQFVEVGVGMRFIRRTIDELVDAKLVAVDKGAAGSRRAPNTYRLAFLPTPDEDAKRVITDEEKLKLLPRKSYSSQPQKVQRERPQEVRQEIPVTTLERCSSNGECTPSKGAVSYIYRVGGKGYGNHHGAQPTPPPPPDPKIMTRNERVEAYAAAHADWIRQNGLPAHTEVAALRTRFALTTTTSEEWVIISAAFTKAIRERRAAVSARDALHLSQKQAGSEPDCRAPA